MNEFLSLKKNVELWEKRSLNTESLGFLSFNGKEKVRGTGFLSERLMENRNTSNIKDDATEIVSSPRSVAFAVPVFQDNINSILIPINNRSKSIDTIKWTQHSQIDKKSNEFKEIFSVTFSQISAINYYQDDVYLYFWTNCCLKFEFVYVTQKGNIISNDKINWYESDSK
jgi:hypothetical protein